MTSHPIRPLAPEDHDAWLRLWQGYLAFYETELPPGVTAALWQRLLQPGVGHEGLVALGEAGMPIGFAHYLTHASTWSSGSYCYLEDLYVDAAARGRGVGGALIEAVETAARKRGCLRLYLMTQETNQDARYLYDRKFGPATFVRYAKALD